MITPVIAKMEDVDGNEVELMVLEIQYDENMGEYICACVNERGIAFQVKFVQLIFQIDKNPMVGKMGMVIGRRPFP